MIERKSLTPVVIVGCQRSGTTLLRSILGRHPALLEHPDEPQYLYWLYQRFGHVIDDVPTAVNYLAQHPYLPDTLTKEQLAKHFSPYSKLALSEFVELYLQAWGGADIRTKRPLLKDPAWIFHLDLVQEMFPGTAVIHIVRDPRANVSSQISRWPQISVWEASVSWRKAVRQARAWDNSHDACYVEITYRNLLHNPEATLKKICQALNLDYAPSMLSPQRESAVDRSGDKSPRARYRSLDPSRQDRWRKKLTPLDVSIVEQACHREMAWWDYQPVNPPVPTAQIVSRQLQEITHYFYKQTGKTVKAYGRKLGWKLGYGALPLPQN